MPKLTLKGEYTKLGRGVNSPEKIAKYFSLIGGEPAPSVVTVKGNSDSQATAKIVDASSYGRKNNYGLFEGVEERHSPVVASTDEIKALESQAPSGDIVAYKVFSRRLNDWAVSEYDLTELMNELDNVAMSTGGQVQLVTDRSDPDVRTVEVRNSFGARVSLNVKQPPATIKRETLNCLRNVVKPMISENDGQFVEVGYIGDGQRI